MVPAGARISAGKSGSVDRSLPKTALTLVKRSPVSCMPSPESPAKRMTTLLIDLSSTGRCAMSATLVNPRDVVVWFEGNAKVTPVAASQTGCDEGPHPPLLRDGGLVDA